MGAGGQREENAHDLGWQVVAGAVFDFIDLDGLGRQQQDTRSRERLADHKADEADLLAGEGADLGGEFGAAVADDGAVEISKLEIGHTSGRGGTGREKIPGIAVELIPFHRRAGPGDFSGSGWGLAAVGEEAREAGGGEGEYDQYKRYETHACNLAR